MKIGLISDTHGDIDRMERALELLQETDCLLHAGDLYRDSRWIQQHYHGVVTAVTGNGDPRSAGPEERLIKLDELSILLCHGHTHLVQRSLTHLYYHGLEKKADVVVFGHTHVPMIQKEELILINPGTTTRPRSHYGHTCAILVTGSTPSIDIISLNTGKTILQQLF